MDITLKDMIISNDRPFTLIAGPCMIESEELVMQVAEELIRITSELKIPYIFKASYDKANRSSGDSYRGPGIDKGLKILQKVKETFNVPLLTDVHTSEEAKTAAHVVDILQIPAFLCRQTDLVEDAARTGAIVNIKKGQFLAPWDMEHIIKKAVNVGNNNIAVTERGASFGYNTLITDIRSLVIMRRWGYPVIFDATHSVQEPGGLGGKSGGKREFVYPLAKAALTAKIAGIFTEVHPDPDNGKSDGPNMLKLADMRSILTNLKRIDDLIKEME